MPLTVEEILAHEDFLQKEIAQKQALLGAYQVLREHTCGHGPKLEPLQLVESTNFPAPVNEPPPRPKPYIHPGLDAIGSRHGTNGQIVSWAIKHMTEDYSVTTLAALLKREGYALPGQQISVVLTRMKNRGEIQETSRGHGRIGAIFRKPESPPPLTVAGTDQTESTAPKTGPIDAT